jgi:hypothetical protein
MDHESFTTSHIKAGSQGKNEPEETMFNKILNNSKDFWKEFMTYISLKYFNLYVKIINNNVLENGSINKPAEIRNQQLIRPISMQRLGKYIPAATIG